MHCAQHKRAARRRGFTLVELLVVIGIIVVLAAILMPVISHVRIAAQKADTQNQIQALSSAIKQYFDSFHAYPGPLGDAQMYGQTGSAPMPSGITGGQVTMAENLFLGLVGGLRRPAAQAPIIYQPPGQGTGIGNLSSAGAAAYDSIIKDWAGQISSGKFIDSLGQPAGDTVVPEFLDRFRDHPMPILYLRARPGRAGVMSDASLDQAGRPAFEQYQYDLRQIRPYTAVRMYANVQGLNYIDANQYLGALQNKGRNDNALI